MFPDIANMLGEEASPAAEGEVPTSPEEIMKLIQAFEASGGSFDSPDVPQDLRELVNSIKGSQSGAKKEGESVEVIPEPSFVVKTSDDTGRKVFINICGSEHVPAAGNWAGGVPEEVKQALAQQSHTEEGAEVLRFPISMGPLRRDLDKRGDPCFVTDCVFNIEVARNAAQDRRLKQFVIELCLGWAGQKHKLSLDPKFKLPKILYKGSQVEAQRMRVDKKPMVTEIKDVPDEPDFPLLTKPRKPGPKPEKKLPPGSQGAVARAQEGGRGGEGSKGAPTAAGATEKASGSGAEAARERGGAWHELEYEGRPVEAIVVRIGLPSSAGEAPGVVAEKTEVFLSGDRLSVSFRGSQVLTLQLAFAGNGTACTAQLARSGANGAGWELRVRVPVLPLGEWIEQMRRDAPHKMGTLQLSSTQLLVEDDP